MEFHIWKSKFEFFRIFVYLLFGLIFWLNLLYIYFYDISFNYRDDNLNSYILNPELQGGLSYQEVVNDIKWKSKDMKHINDEMVYGRHLIKCQKHQGLDIKVCIWFLHLASTIQLVLKFNGWCSIHISNLRKINCFRFFNNEERSSY